MQLPFKLWEKIFWARMVNKCRKRKKQTNGKSYSSIMILWYHYCKRGVTETKNSFHCFCNVIIPKNIVCFPREEKFRSCSIFQSDCWRSKKTQLIKTSKEMKQVLLNKLSSFAKSVLSLPFYLAPHLIKTSHPLKKNDYLTINQLPQSKLTFQLLTTQGKMSMCLYNWLQI